MFVAELHLLHLHRHTHSHPLYVLLTPHPTCNMQSSFFGNILGGWICWKKNRVVKVMYLGLQLLVEYRLDHFNLLRTSKSAANTWSSNRKSQKSSRFVELKVRYCTFICCVSPSGRVIYIYIFYYVLKMKVKESMYLLALVFYLYVWFIMKYFLCIVASAIRLFLFVSETDTTKKSIGRLRLRATVITQESQTLWRVCGLMAAERGAGKVPELLVWPVWEGKW